MSGLYGEELAAALRERQREIQDTIDRRMERIYNGQTDMDDCFLSHKAELQHLDNIGLQLDILQGDGLMEINVVVCDDGSIHEPRWVETRYGARLVANGVFANSVKALIKKTGWKLETRKVPCWTRFFSGGGRGRCAAFLGRYDVVRWHTNMVTGEYWGWDRYAE